ncbi:MAG: SDR family NAD(P)-dependent oxidoreductase [Saprospiraceae bacterium]
MEDKGKYPFSKTQWENCIEVLSFLKEDPFNNPDNQLFGTLITKIHKKAKKAKRQQPDEEANKADIELGKKSVIVKNALNNQTTYTAGTYEQKAYQTLKNKKNCYCCTDAYNQMHFYYHRLCPTCAEEHYNYRFTDIDLKGRNVILTGGRVKIGYATALKLLESGANLTITTRFPALALEDFQKEKNYEHWKNRLFIYGLDLRNLKAIKAFIDFYKQKHQSLDILINNAAQTVKYPNNYYEPLIAKEQKLLEINNKKLPLIANDTAIFQSSNSLLSNKILSEAEIQLNRFGQPVDERLKTSWNSNLEEISIFELIEVNLINQIAPYILIKELLPLIKASSNQFKFIVNVTSTEGIFNHSNKSTYHPHTNMTKAALNMMTHTSARDFKKYNISMNSVDVGWISTGAIEPLRKKQFEEGYVPPLDSVDGASRIFHPIIDTLKNNKISLTGYLLKNFRVKPW